MKEPAAKPTTIELPMKPRDRTAACPDETRCQLEVIWDDGRGALTVHDGPRDSKLVQVGLIGEKGCDAKVRVGMIYSFAPIAVGAAVVDGETKRWERELYGCLDRPQFLGQIPAHLRSVRYAGMSPGESVALTVYKSEEGETYSWHVYVERRGGAKQPEPLHLSFNASSSDDLSVSAALSPRTDSLYVVESKAIVGSGIRATYYLYVFAPKMGSWGLIRSGTVPLPPDAEYLSHRHYTVDRDGMVAGYWSANSTGRRVVDSDGEWCLADGYEDTKDFQDYDFVGDLWSINAMAFSSANYRVTGQVVQDRDFVWLREYPHDYSHLGYQFMRNWHYELVFSTDNAAPWEKFYTRSQRTFRDDGYYYRAELGSNAWVSKTSGLTLEFVASFSQTQKLTPIDTVYFFSEIISDTIFEAYSYHDGAVGLGVTPGGWLLRNEAASVAVDIDLSPVHSEVAGVVGPNPTESPPGCGDMINSMVGRYTLEDIHLQSILYPINLGSYYAILASFTAINNPGGEIYAGVLVEATQGAAATWHIYRNGQDVTAGVAECIGRPLSELAAIYWRA